MVFIGTMEAPIPQPLQSNAARKWSLAVLLTLIFSGIALLFWYQELRYQLPTPVPPDYKDVPTGAAIALPASFNSNTNKPQFLHFFNPDCPCSRFNMKHFKELVNTYGSKVAFTIVAMVPEEDYTADDIRKRFDLNLPVSFDTSLAATCGVYATPQAVIINGDKLSYRGNYNKSRYCTDPKTNYAQIALDSLLNSTNSPRLDAIAYTAYGCTLPTCKK